MSRTQLAPTENAELIEIPIYLETDDVFISTLRLRVEETWSGIDNGVPLKLRIAFDEEKRVLRIAELSVSPTTEDGTVDGLTLKSISTDRIFRAMYEDAKSAATIDFDEAGKKFMERQARTVVDDEFLINIAPAYFIAQVFRQNVAQMMSDQIGIPVSTAGWYAREGRKRRIF